MREGISLGIRGVLVMGCHCYKEMAVGRERYDERPVFVTSIFAMTSECPDACSMFVSKN